MTKRQAWKILKRACAFQEAYREAHSDEMLPPAPFFCTSSPYRRATDRAAMLIVRRLARRMRKAGVLLDGQALVCNWGRWVRPRLHYLRRGVRKIIHIEFHPPPPGETIAAEIDLSSATSAQDVARAAAEAIREAMKPLPPDAQADDFGLSERALQHARSSVLTFTEARERQASILCRQEKP